MLTKDKAPAPITVDLARLPMLLTTLHLPTIGQLWADFAERSDREGGRRPAISQPCSSTNSPNAFSGASSVTCRMPICRRARASPPSTSPPSR